MPKGVVTHDTGGTKEATAACYAAIRKVIATKGSCSESDARGIAMSMYPVPVLVRVGAQKLKNRKRGSACRFAEEIQRFMDGGSIGPDAVEWFRIVGGNRQLTRLKQGTKGGAAEGVKWDSARREFVAA